MSVMTASRLAWIEEPQQEERKSHMIPSSYAVDTTTVAAPAAKTVKSAVRTLQVIEFLAERSAPATISQIASSLRFPQSSTSMLMTCLMNLGYVQYDQRDRTYRPSSKLAGLFVGLQVFQRS